MKPDWQTEDGSVRLYHGDCLQILPELEAESIDAMVTDPPYFLPATHYSVRTGFARSLSDLLILEHFFRDVFKAARKVLKPTGVAYVFCDGQSYAPFYVTAYSQFKKLRPLIWDKQTAFNGYTWRHQHELILFAESEDAPALATGDGDILRCRAVPIDDREHLAEKPVELLQQLVAKCGEVVIDTFMGSASTAIACIRAGKKFVGCEADAEYFRLAVSRIEAELSRAPLFDKPPQIQRTFLGETA